MSPSSTSVRLDARINSACGASRVTSSALIARRSLASQIESALTKLTVLRGSDQAGPVLGAALERAVRALDQLAPEASRARGDARDEIMRRLAEIDRALIASAIEAVGEKDRRALEKEADDELAPFRARLSDEAYQQSRRQAVQRLVRDRFNLPALQP